LHNLLIMGAGRSGTSMAAGLFRESGAYMGESFHPPRAANRFGFFEDGQINAINDQILLRMLQRGWPRRAWRFAPAIHRHPHALWLAAPRSVRAADVSPELREAMRKHVARAPYCLKDPRFGLTLPTWRPELPQTRFVVVFRDPDTTVDSQLREAREIATRLPLTPGWAYKAWYRMYRRLLDDLSREGHWLFVRYEQIATGQALSALAAFAQTEPCTTQIRPDVRRAQPRADSSARARRCRVLFERLLSRADHDLACWSRRA
jgi:Sulfotransferase family